MRFTPNWCCTCVGFRVTLLTWILWLILQYKLFFLGVRPLESWCVLLVLPSTIQLVINIWYCMVLDPSTIESMVPYNVWYLHNSAICPLDEVLPLINTLYSNIWGGGKGGFRGQYHGSKNDTRGFRCNLKRLAADYAGPPLIWMHGRNRVSGKPALDKAHLGDGASAIMRPVFGVSGVLLWWRMEMARAWTAGLAATRWVCLRQLSTRRCEDAMHSSPFSGRLIHCAPASYHWPWICQTMITMTKMTQALHADMW